jgi:outer membrane protein assembly factor BamD
MYTDAWRAIHTGSYRDALRMLRRLEARHPFGPYAEQAQLDQIYTTYRMRERAGAVDEANRFIRENPRSGNLDYAYYMKGIAWFEEYPGLFERLFNLDLARRDVSNARRSFDAFRELVERYPDSEYADDARQRMVYLRNKLARHEWYVGEYYIRRGAYVAAAGRATYALENYQPSPMTPYLLDIMVQAYEALEEGDLATDARRVRDRNYPEHRPGRNPPKG